MKAIVLAAGLGERMRPLTIVRAKPVLPVLNRPLLHWTLERLARQGVTDVVVNLHHLPSTVRRALGDGRAFGLTIRYSHERVILGTAGGARRMRRFFGDDPFLIVNGDVLFDLDVRRLVREHRRSGAQATLALRRHPHARRYGGVVIDPAGRVKAIIGRPAPVRGRPWLFMGVHVMEPALLSRLPDGPSDSVRDLYIPLLAEGGRIHGVPVEGAWYDFGSPSLYLSSHMSLLASGFRSVRPRARLVHRDARVAAGARVARSVVGPGCVIEPGARIVDSVLWEDVRVGAGAQVVGSILAGRARVSAGEAVRGAVVVPTRGGVVRTEIGG
jgi:mannose-1-phosphate guanylyltransferase